jgi:Protein of unknown function (DUF1194)
MGEGRARTGGLRTIASQALSSCRRLSPLALGALLTVASPPAFTQTEAVDLALVLATDVSYSVDDDEARLQRLGVFQAFRSPEVIKAIQAGALGRIAVAYIEFSSANAGRVSVDWQVIHDQASADAFVDALAGTRRLDGVQTSISSGIQLAARLLETIDFRATRKVIDVSGDGPNNDGRLVVPTRDETIAKGITVNGLPIITESNKTDIYYLPDLDKYYAGCVIGGPNAFMHVAYGFEDFARAIRRKLVLEISDAGQPAGQDAWVVKVAAGSRPSRTTPVYERGCDIGERMRYGGVR